jgi:hypothetical protein
MQAFVHIVSEGRVKTRLALAAAFLFFVLYSAPHRVHHLFEELGVSPESSDDAATGSERHTHRDDNSEHNNDSHKHDNTSGGSAKADCIIQAVAQNFHFAPPQATDVSYLELKAEIRPAVSVAPHYHFSLSPFSQRAPPQA